MFLHLGKTSQRIQKRHGYRRESSRGEKGWQKQSMKHPECTCNIKCEDYKFSNNECKYKAHGGNIDETLFG